MAFFALLQWCFHIKLNAGQAVHLSSPLQATTGDKRKSLLRHDQGGKGWNLRAISHLEFHSPWTLTFPIAESKI
jgi:hypothetical protein